MRVTRFGDPPTVPTRSPGRRSVTKRAVVRVTHASVGATDLTAIRGKYLLQPFPRFVPGYDLIGTIEHLGAGGHPRLSVGQRVAGILPRMGAHATLLSVAPSLLVPVPDGLDSATAATAPLDGVTAQFALDALDTTHGPILVQGAGGAVGGWATQLAVARGLTVFGTASPRTRQRAEALGARVLDYRDPDWINALVEATGGGVVGAIDHTGSRELHRAVSPQGRIVRIAFDGTHRHPQRATLAGFVSATLRRHAHPSERVCSIPLIVAARRAAYRNTLSAVLTDLTTGALLPPRVHEVRFEDYASALTDAERCVPGSKAVLAMP
ncbi:hypothetical protein GCM10022198_11460 [Klugiella xanthotipulae]